MMTILFKCIAAIQPHKKLEQGFHPAAIDGNPAMDYLDLMSVRMSASAIAV